MEKTLRTSAYPVEYHIEKGKVSVHEAPIPIQNAFHLFLLGKQNINEDTFLGDFKQILTVSIFDYLRNEKGIETSIIGLGVRRFISDSHTLGNTSKDEFDNIIAANKNYTKFRNDIGWLLVLIENGLIGALPEKLTEIFELYKGEYLSLLDFNSIQEFVENWSKSIAFESDHEDYTIKCPGKGLVYNCGFYFTLCLLIGDLIKNFKFVTKFPFYKTIQSRNGQLVVPISPNELWNNALEIVINYEG